MSVSPAMRPALSDEPPSPSTEVASCEVTRCYTTVKIMVETIIKRSGVGPEVTSKWTTEKVMWVGINCSKSCATTMKLYEYQSGYMRFGRRVVPELPVD
jgi:hypothetical protein